MRPFAVIIAVCCLLLCATGWCQDQSVVADNTQQPQQQVVTIAPQPVPQPLLVLDKGLLGWRAKVVYGVPVVVQPAPVICVQPVRIIKPYVVWKPVVVWR